MKKLNYFLVLLTFFLSSSQLSALSTQTPVTISQSCIDDEGVFLLVGMRWLRAEAINLTTDGIFVLEEGHWMSIEDAIECDNYWVWICSNCGKRNVQGVSRCSGCGKRQ